MVGLQPSPEAERVARRAEGNHRSVTERVGVGPHAPTKMTVAALYDIHGNLPALEAVLDDVGRAGVDHLVIGGDVVPGPMARATIERLLTLDLPVDWIQGNCEVALLADLAGRQLAPMPEEARSIIHWQAAQMR